MSNLIVTGKTAEAHVSSADDGALYAGIFGVEDYILNVGSKLEFEQTGANTIRIHDGDFIMQGRQGRIPYGSTEDVQFTSGSVGYNKITYIVVRYALADGLESMELVSIDGELTEGNPEPPTLTRGNILEGNPVREVPLVKIVFNGVNISSVTKAPDGFKENDQIGEIKERLNEIEAAMEDIKSVEVLDVWNVSHGDYELICSQQCRTQGVELDDESHYAAMKNADFILVLGSEANEKHILKRNHSPQSWITGFGHFMTDVYMQNGSVRGTITTRNITVSSGAGTNTVTALETVAAISHNNDDSMKWENPTARGLSVTEPMIIISYKYPRSR